MTKEERAKFWHQEMLDRAEDWDKEWFYIQGATEQRKIDIDKACEWLTEHFNRTLKEFENGGKFVEQLFTTEVEDAFRKAMEE